MAYDSFNVLKSSAVPLPIENVDTDQIIPARFLKATERTGFGDNLNRTEIGINQVSLIVHFCML